MSEPDKIICPYCKSPDHVIKKGHSYKSNKQRYYCKQCKRRFRETTAYKGEINTKITREYGSHNGSVTVKSLQVLTLDDALKIAGVDLNVWDVDRYIVNSWETTMGNNKTNTGNPETYTNWQVKVWLKKKVVEIDELIIKELIKKIKTYKPEKFNIFLSDKKYFMYEISLVDQHFGMLAWSDETGHDYDHKISEEIYLAAINDSLGKVPYKKIESILIPIGDDFFHINNPELVTPKAKNRLDTDTRLAKIFSAGELAVIKGVDISRQVAPVKLVYVPGNHDPQTSYYLARVLMAYYRNVKNVTVDCSPTTRKYISYGISLIGFTHGDEEPHRDLPRIMADEVPELWVNSKVREFHLGHIHKEKEIKFVTTDSFGSTTVRILPSLARPDFWHYKKGYVGRNFTSQSFLWDKQNGLSSIVQTYQ